MTRYDLAIYEPASTPIYVQGAPTLGGAERQMVILARSLANLGLRVAHVVARVHSLPGRADGVDLVPQDPIPADVGFRGRLSRVSDALYRADAHVYLQRSAGLETGLVGTYARSRRRAFIYSTSSPLDLLRGLPLQRHESVGARIGRQLAHAVVVQTRDQLRTARRQHKLVYIPSFCEPAAPNAHPERTTFLWVGRAAPYKNPAAFVELARQVPEAQFTMVGVGPSDYSAVNIDGSKSLPNLELIPPLPRSELLPLYWRAVAVVNTSDFEGFPNTFMEGWARGALALSLTVDPDAVINRYGIGRTAGGSPAVLAHAARCMWRERNHLGPQRDAAIRYVIDVHGPDRIGARWFELVSSFAASGSAPYRLLARGIRGE
jgi:glycosyltransferase involved in cell wall biosynthesis